MENENIQGQNMQRQFAGAHIEKINVRKLFLKYLRYWYWFVISAGVCFLIAFLFLKTQPFKYQVKTEILLRQSEKNSIPYKELAMLEALGYSNGEKEVEDEIEVLTSKSLIAQVIDSLGVKNSYYQKEGWKYSELYKNTPFVLGTDSPDFNDVLPATLTFSIKKNGANGFNIKIKTDTKKQTITIGNISEPFTTFAGDFQLTLTGQPFDENATYRIVVNRTADLVEELNGNVKVVATNKKSNAIRISTKNACVEKSKDVLNKLVELYNYDAVKDKKLLSQITKDFIDKRIKFIEEALYSVEKNEEEYRKQNELTNIEIDTKLYLASANDYERSRVALQSQFGMIDYLEDWIKDEKNNNGLIPVGLNLESSIVKKTNIPTRDGGFSTADEVLPSGTNVDNGMINSLIADYNNLVLQRMKAVHNSNDQNSSTAQLDKELKELKTNILFSVASAKKGVQISLNDIVAKDNQFKSKVKNLPSQIRESRSIERQQKTKETLYLFLLQKQEELAVSLASETLPVKTIDRANASSIPVSPRRGIIMLLSLIIGGLIPIIYLYLKDLFNNKLENKEELKKKVSAPLLGFISQYSGAEKVVVRENSFSAVAEQFRLVRANLQFLLGAKKQSSVILVTSSISGEGKSFFAINLAMSLVLTKKKTILLDLDIRNPQLSNYLDIHNKSGISIFLSDESSKVTDIIYKSSTTNGLDIIPCGPIPPNPSELLMSERLELLFEELKKSYDYIIVDSAPVGIVSDTFIINKNVDVSVFVVREKYTPKDILPAVSELYEQKKLNNLSLVLNGIDERNANNYGKYYKAYNRRGK